MQFFTGTRCACWIAVATILCLTSMASAQRGSNTSYKISSTFSSVTQLGKTSVTESHFDHAWSNTPTLNAGPPVPSVQAKFNPSAASPQSGLNGEGFDFEDTNLSITYTDALSVRRKTPNLSRSPQVVSTSGSPNSSASTDVNQASASSAYMVTGTVNGTSTIQNTNTLIGAIGISRSTTTAYVFTDELVSISTQRTGASGRVAAAVSVEATTFVTTIKDNIVTFSSPFDVSLFTLGGRSLAGGTLLDFSGEIHGPDASVAVDARNNVSILGAQDADFNITQTSPFLTNGTGTLDLQIRNHIIVFSKATGIYAAVALPSVGSSGDSTGFSLPPIDLAYSFGDFGDQELVTQISSDANGSASENQDPDIFTPDLPPLLSTAAATAAAAPLPAATMIFPLAAVLAAVAGIFVKRQTLRFRES